MKFAVYILVCVALAVIFVPEEIKNAQGAIAFLIFLSIGIIIYHYIKTNK